MREQSKLLQLDSLSNPNNQDLFAYTSKGKKKGLYKKKKSFVQGGEHPSKPLQNKKTIFACQSLWIFFQEKE